MTYSWTILATAFMLNYIIHFAIGQDDLNGFSIPTQDINNNQGFGASNGQVLIPSVVDPLGPTTTTPSPAFSSCFNACRSVQHYNPVCGSDGVTYSNEFRLNCARRCGQQVQMVRGGTCAGL